MKLNSNLWAMGSSLLVSWLFLLAAGAAEAANPENGTNTTHDPAWDALVVARIPIYGAKDFLQFIDTSPAVLGVFVAPWCAHSKDLQGTWRTQRTRACLRHRASPKEEDKAVVSAPPIKEEEQGQKSRGEREREEQEEASKGGDVRGKASVRVDGEEDAPGGTKKPADDVPEAVMTVVAKAPTATRLMSQSWLTLLALLQ